MLKRSMLSILVVLVAVGSLATIAQSQDGEQRAIQKVIESFASAINDKDLPMLLGQIAEDAIIDSRIARGKVSKQGYADAMARAFERRQIVSFEIRQWKLEKRGELWLIVETAYRTKPGEPVKPIELARRAA